MNSEEYEKTAVDLLVNGQPYTHHTETAVRGLAYAILALVEALKEKR